MAELSIKDGAAANRIAARLGPTVTNSIIDGLARELGFRPLQASNKVRKIQLMLAELLADGRSRATASKAIVTLTMEGHHRTVAGQAGMTVDDVDVIVADMKTIGIPTGDLARTGWRAGLKNPSQAKGNSPGTQGAVAPSMTGPRPQRHDQALAYLAQLTMDDSRPQHRGHELEKIVFELLLKEALQPTGNIVNAGEQIDLAFILDGHHYLVECKWEAQPVGLPIVTAFSAKVARKAEGTFGLLLSMSGFVRNINETATRGSRLNCIGIAHQHLIDALEGRTTFTAIVKAARASASTRATFFA